MRKLIVLRGISGCGKSTFIEKNNLKKYTLSTDDLRLCYSAPILNIRGKFEINQIHNSKIWSLLFEMLETRMQHGAFTVIDAMNIDTNTLNKYKDISKKYKYKLYCIDFSDVSLEQTKKQNLNREEYKQVPDSILENMYQKMLNNKIPSGFITLKPDQFEEVYTTPLDLSNYKKIHHIGDIHGCYTTLKEYLNNNGGIKDDEFYIFLGDYLDRGIENVDTLKYMMSIYNKSNVLCLEGNHEIHLWNYANDNKARSYEFEQNTKPQLDAANISKKDIRRFYRKLSQCAYYKYNNNLYLCTHGGLSIFPEKIDYVDTYQMIHGVSSYNDYECVDDNFANNSPNNAYQIHGHRNTNNSPVKMNNNVFNLEGQIEFGGNLRCVQVSKNEIQEIETENNIFKFTPEKNGDFLDQLKANIYIQEKEFGPISSFNFSRQAFLDKIWDKQTMKARGLFVDTEKRKVVARSYNKFFNIDEMPETSIEPLKNNLSFPVTAYVKENGYLGLVSYNEYNDDFLIASKSSINSAHVGYLKSALKNNLSEENLDKLKKYIKENNVTFVFENVDLDNDPHIIKSENKLVLLDIVYNDIDFKKYDYEKLIEIAEKFGLHVKEKAYVLNDLADFENWYNMINKEDFKYNENYIEGFVLEDSNGYMVKTKGYYYRFWKQMRSIAMAVSKYGKYNKVDLLNHEGQKFYAWLIEYNKNNDFDSNNIIKLREIYESNV